ncbi:MAG: hypothetical protein AAFY41_08630 [Bacteroidota bacterium]
MKLKNGDKSVVKNAYHNVLMWRGETHRFKRNSKEFEGEIIGINELGKLSIRVGKEFKTFDIKEIKFIA